MQETRRAAPPAKLSRSSASTTEGPRQGGPASLLDRTTQEITASLNEPEENRLQEFNNFYHNTPNRAIGENSALFFKKTKTKTKVPPERETSGFPDLEEELHGLRG